MLKTSHSVGHFKQAVNRSELIREQKKDTLPSSNQQILVDLGLPEGFTIGQAIGEGDCFFHAVAQGLKYLKPDINFTIKSLRNICKAFAESQLGLDSSWLTEALKNDGRSISYYIPRIEFTADDIKKGSKVIDRLKSTTAMWGLPDIDGRIICITYDVRLHFIEVNTTCDGENVITQHIIDRGGYQKDTFNSEVFNKEVYYRENTIHIINKGDFHFEPILRGTVEQVLSYYYDTMASGKKSDSESVCFQQISEVEMNDVTDNQMDCEYYKEPSPGVEVLPADSTIGTIVGYEDRLSNEELQYKQDSEFQESPVSSRVADSSSIDSDSVWHSTLTDCRSTVGTANDTDLTDCEIVKRAILFVRIFFEEFEKKLSEFLKEAKPDSKTRKAGKIVDQSASIVNNFIPPSGVKLIFSKLCESMVFFSAKEHRKGAKKVSATVTPFKNEIREILVKAGLEIFQSFEIQFTKIKDTDQLYWERGIEKLAIDAVSRVINYISVVINYISVHNEEEGFSVDLITKGVVLGKSKRNFMHVGHQVKDKQSGKILMTSELYRGVGIVKIDSGIIEYYRSREYDYAERYGYRLPFAWELEKWWEVNKKYMLGNPPEKEEYVRILDREKKERLASSILKEINGDDLTKRKDMAELYKKIENLQIKKEKSIRPFLFNIGPLPRLFIKRRRMLVDLANMLDKESQELEMSRTILISGRHGTGKSELARSYVHDKENATWKNVIWIDAEMPNILLSSFHRLAQELEISIEKGKGIKRVDVKMKTESQQEKKIKSIVEDIYKNFRDARSLFIFDNVSSYKDIEEFLPSYFFHLFVGREKPYVLITSSSKNWTGEIEKIVLDEGFTLPEAIDFIETALGIDGRLCNADLITKLAKTLHYSPLALKEATKYIKEEGVSISQYLEHYSKEMQKLNLDCFKAQDISPELLITLKINCDKIKEEKDVGQRSHDILSFMAYLSPGPIDTTEFFLQEESEKDQQNVSDALSLLDKFSVIELEESIARVHIIVQKTIRLEKEQEGAEEEVLKKIMKSFMDSGTTSVSHILSVWSYASKYSGLVNEFINFTYNGSTILHLLSQNGNEEVIKLILEKIDSNKLSEIINTIDKMKRTPLDCAAMYGHLEIVKYFIKKGSNLEGDNRDLTPLHWAAVCGQLEVVKHFIDNKKYWEVDKLSRENGTPLHYAVTSGNIDIVECLIEKGANVNLQDESSGPLHFAIEEGRLDIVKYLVEKGADINQLDKNGINPLLSAVISGNVDIVRYLVERVANVNLQDRDGMGPLHYAVINDNIDIIKYLVEKEADVNLQNKEGVSPLFLAIRYNRFNIAKYLVMQSIIVNLQNKDGLSLVCHAAESDRLNIVKRLLREKAIANLCEKNGMSSLYYGTESDRLDIAKYLLKEKSSIIFNRSDKESSMSFLYYTNLYDRLDNIKSLIVRSTMVDPQNKEGMSSLHFAVICGHSDLTDYLVREGANVNEQDKEGMSSLHVAVACDHSDIIDYLVANGANVNKQNKEGLSPLHIAVIHGHLGSVKYLVEKGADVNLRDRYGISPLFYALIITASCPDIASYLIKYSSFLVQEVNMESEFTNLSHNNAPDIICYPETQSSALELRVQLHKRHQKRSAYFSKSNKKRKLEDVSVTSKENASNVELLQGSQNLPSGISMQLEGLAGRMYDMIEKSMVNMNSEMPGCSFNSVAVESLNNNNLRR